MRKVCGGCKKRRDIKFFSPKGKGRWEAKCRDCRNAEARERRAKKRAEKDLLAEAEAIVEAAMPAEMEHAEDVSRETSRHDPVDDGMVLVPTEMAGYLATPDKLEDMIRELVPDALSRLYGHLWQLRLLGSRIVMGNYLPQDMTAYQKSLDKILDIVEVRRKELSSRDVGDELLEEFRNFQSNAGFVKKDAS